MRDDETGQHVLQLVELSAPSTTRPRLTEERELELAQIERRTAGCYAQMENLTYKIGKLVADLEKGPPDDDQREKV